MREVLEDRIAMGNETIIIHPFWEPQVRFISNIEETVKKCYHNNKKELNEIGYSNLTGKDEKKPYKGATYKAPKSECSQMVYSVIQNNNIRLRTENGKSKKITETMIGKILGVNYKTVAVKAKDYKTFYTIDEPISKRVQKNRNLYLNIEDFILSKTTTII